MTVRSRQRDLRLGITGSHWDLLSGSHQGVALIGLREWCSDVVGERFHDNPLAVKRWECIVPRLNGKKVDPGTGQLLREFIDYPIDWQPDPENSRYPFGSFNETERFVVARELLARTNPAAPDIGVPTSIGELRDLPSLVQSWGKTLLQKVATGYLVWRWVVKPMLKDINRLCQFSDEVRKRLDTLDTLLVGNAIRRNLKLRHNRTVTRSSVPAQSNGTMLTFTRETSFTEEVWGSARWRLLERTNLRNQRLWTDLDSKVSLARRLVAGVTSYEALATAWELMPWSWFVDWFGRVGDFITSTNNTISCDCESICLMRKTTSLSVYTPKVLENWCSLSGTWFERETYKSRFPIAPWLVQVAPPLFTVPILTSRQWSILGALAVLRSPVREIKRKLKSNTRWVHLSNGRRALVNWKTFLPSKR